MPASYTHNAFGKQVLSNITDEKIKQLITKNINFYNIGLQGPDLLFSYKVLKKNPITALGNQMHQDIATSFFNHAKALLQETKDERAIAYALGFINHFILDSECHNYIDTIKVEKQSSHFLIERDLDHRFIKINQDPINTNVAKSYTINLEVAKVIAPFFQLEPQVILKTLKSFRFNMGLFACKNPIKRKTILGAMTLARATKYKAMVMTGVFEPNLKENIDELVNKFNHAINIATKEIVEFYYSYLNDTEISNRFNYNYE